MRSRFKALLESGLATLGPAALSRRAFRRRALVLAYHNILPDGAAPGADSSLHLPLATFRAQLDALQAVARVVPLGELLAGPAATDRPRVAVTFDDAYRGAVLAGLPELRRRGLASTMFVTPGMLGQAGFWWDQVRDPATGRLPDAFRADALQAGRGEGERVLALPAARRLERVEPPAFARPATPAEFEAAAGVDPMLTLGAHTWSHPNLARLDRQELAAELEPPLAWLRARFPRVEPWLAYPYGLSAPAVEAAAAGAGYRCAFLVNGGWLPADGGAPLAMPRLNVPAGLSAAGLVLRLSGIGAR